MGNRVILSLLLICVLIKLTFGFSPHMPLTNAVPFVAHYLSRYRGICTGALVSRTAVITAAVCCVNHGSGMIDRRPINVIVGTVYRHQKRGIRVQVTKIIKQPIPNTANRYYLTQISFALMILKKSIPDPYVSLPLRAIKVNYEMSSDSFRLKEECFTAGWHFFYQGDTIHPGFKFLLQRNLRIQFLEYVKKEMYCDLLHEKFKNLLESHGYSGMHDHTSEICLKDHEKVAQPCHGMFGAPLVCRGHLVGLLSAPDAQWTNCTGMSNIFNLFGSTYSKPFFQCISKFFKPDIEKVDMHKVMKFSYGSQETDEDIPELYDHLVPRESEEEAEEVTEGDNQY